jgi:hypothetical protein
VLGKTISGVVVATITKSMSSGFKLANDKADCPAAIAMLLVVSSDDAMWRD